jgi:hypothetical protein
MKRRYLNEKQRRRNKIARDLASKRYRQRIVPDKNKKPYFPPEIDDYDDEY